MISTKTNKPNIHKQKHTLDLEKHKHPKIPNFTKD